MAHEKVDAFVCSSQLSTLEFSQALWNIIGRDGENIPFVLHHGCVECTHKKRYCRDLIVEGAIMDPNANRVAGVNLIEEKPQVMFITF